MTDHRIGLTEGLLIAGVPAAGYWLAFLYELGYCIYFDIPAQFVDIGLLNVLIAIVGFAGFLAMIHLYGGLFYTLSGIFHRAIRTALFRVAVIFCAIAGISIVFRLTEAQFIGSAILFGGFHAFGEFVFPLITQRKIKGYINKLEAQDRFELEQRGNNRGQTTILI